MEFLRQVRVPEQAKNSFENFHGFIANERFNIEHQKFDIFQNQAFVHHCRNVLWWVSKFLFRAKNYTLGGWVAYVVNQAVGKL